MVEEISLEVTENAATQKVVGSVVSCFLSVFKQVQDNVLNRPWLILFHLTIPSYLKQYIFIWDRTV